MRHYKFVEWEAADFETVISNPLPQALIAYDNGDPQPLKDLHIATSNAVYKSGGWAIPYDEYLRKYWVKTKYYGIIEMYAMNKTDIRKELKSETLKIVEVTD